MEQITHRAMYSEAAARRAWKESERHAAEERAKANGVQKANSRRKMAKASRKPTGDGNLGKSSNLMLQVNLETPGTWRPSDKPGWPPSKPP